MYTSEVTARSAIRALERETRGELGRRHIGVVAGPSGTGKTACLVQIGLDALLRGHRVLHVSNEAPIDHLRAYYDELFSELERTTRLSEAQTVQLDLERRRLLISLPTAALRVPKLSEAAAAAQGALGGDPDLVIIEGFDFEGATVDEVEQVRALATRLNAEVWMGVLTHRHVPVSHPQGYPAPIDRYEGLLDVIVGLEPAKGNVRLRVLKGHGAGEEGARGLLLDAVTMQLVEVRRDSDPEGYRNRTRFTLHSGGAGGAEAAFGEMAERYGLAEITFSFEGHTNRVRSRGLRLLSDSELRAGDVSLRYVSHRLKRVFPQDPQVHKVLQSIWHQIKPCQQVFVIGSIQSDGTVRGGTGWGSELARRWKCELNVFDQTQSKWFRWVAGEGQWQPHTPLIRSPRFAGTGTRNLEPIGLKAIEELFERSFGQQE
jgi:hypothetical protein